MYQQLTPNGIELLSIITWLAQLVLATGDAKMCIRDRWYVRTCFGRNGHLDFIDNIFWLIIAATHCKEGLSLIHIQMCIRDRQGNEPSVSKPSVRPISLRRAVTLAYLMADSESMAMERPATQMCIRDRFSIRLNGIHYTTELGSEYDCSLNLHHL